MQQGRHPTRAWQIMLTAVRERLTPNSPDMDRRWLQVARVPLVAGTAPAALVAA
jgi:hypothetical protein